MRQVTSIQLHRSGPFGQTLEVDGRQEFESDRERKHVI